MEVKKKKGKEKPDPKVCAIFSAQLRSVIPTNAWLAERAGISEPAVAEYVNGVSLPRADILKRISDATGKSIGFLLTGKDLSKSTGCNITENTDYHKLLDIVLNSGVENAIDAVKFTLESRHKQVEAEVELKEDIGKLKNEAVEIRSEIKEIRLCLQGLASSGTGTDGRP